jgi:hypothetical protein
LKADNFIKRIISDLVGSHIKNGLPYDRDYVSEKVYWAINQRFVNADHWPPEYTDAYHKLCS